MQKQESIFRKSYKLPTEKENVAQTLNNVTKYKSNMSIPNLLVPNHIFHFNQLNKQSSIKQLVRKNTFETYKMEGMRSSLNILKIQNMLASPKIKTTTHKQLYEINELQNINLMKIYGSDFLKNSIKNQGEPADFLKNHDINYNLRAKMIDWMIQVFTSYKCNDSTFFKSVELMDKYFLLVPENQQIKELHLVGVTAMFMATKMQEIYPLKLKVIYDKIAHKKLTTQEIKQKEAQFLVLFHSNIISNNLYDIIKMLIHTFSQQVEFTYKQIEQLQKICVYIAKMVTYDYTLITKNKLDLLAAGIISTAFKMFEQSCNNNFTIDEHLKRIIQLLNISKQKVTDCSNKILRLIKNFDKIYLSLPNFKKFNKMNFQGQINKQYISL